MRKMQMVFILCFAAAAMSAQQRTETEFSAEIKAINAEAATDREGFENELAMEYKVTTRKIKDLKSRYGMSDGDVFMTLETSRKSKKPVDTVAEEFKKNKAKGWGFIAQEMGIKPGSPEFKAMKEEAKKRQEKLKAKAQQDKGAVKGAGGKANQGKRP